MKKNSHQLQICNRRVLSSMIFNSYSANSLVAADNLLLSIHLDSYLDAEKPANRKSANRCRITYKTPFFKKTNVQKALVFLLL